MVTAFFHGILSHGSKQFFHVDLQTEKKRKNYPPGA